MSQERYFFIQKELRKEGAELFMGQCYELYLENRSQPHFKISAINRKGYECFTLVKTNLKETHIIDFIDKFSSEREKKVHLVLVDFFENWILKIKALEQKYYGKLEFIFLNRSRKKKISL